MKYDYVLAEASRRLSMGKVVEGHNARCSDDGVWKREAWSVGAKTGDTGEPRGGGCGGGPCRRWSLDGEEVC